MYALECDAQKVKKNGGRLMFSMQDAGRSNVLCSWGQACTL